MLRFFRADEANPARWMTRRYLFALLAIGLLAASAFGTVGLLISEHESTLAVVNVSGRQRMLSQRTALYASLIARTQEAQQKRRYRDELTESARLLEESHFVLLGKANSLDIALSPSAASINRYYEGPYPLNTQMQNYLRELKVILNTDLNDITPTHPSVIYVMNVAPEQLLKSLDEMVKFYQKEGEDVFDLLQILEGLFFALAFIILTVEALFIFRPMVQHVTGQMNRISQFSREMEDTVKKRTNELDEARQSAVRANKAKSRFLAAAGHDLKQPLEAIGMFSGMLEKRVEDPRNQAILGDMHQAQRSMRSLLDSILSLSKLEAGVIEPHPIHFALQPLFDQLVREYRPSAQVKSLEIRMVPTSVELHSDPLLVERILRNFLSNAIRYTHEGRILVGCRHDGENVHIEVWDTGRGIPEEGLERVFTEFAQLDDPERDRSEGIGLGLAIVKRLASLLKVEITCSSVVEKGSKFGVVLPKN